MAWVDLGLRVVSRFMGIGVMQDLAKLLLADPGGREQIAYSDFSPPLLHGDQVVLKTQRWLGNNFTSSISVHEMNQIAGLSKRTFLRRFQKATGFSPVAYLQALRVQGAKELLESTRQAVEQIAWDVGYTDVSAFHVVFKRRTGLTPGEYRSRFNHDAHKGNPYRSG